MSHEEKMTKNVLITGATGFLCSQLARKFLNQGYRVWGLTRNRLRAKELFENYPLWTPIYQDVCETLELDVDFDFIIHGASPASPQLYKNFPVDIIKPNTIGTLKVLEYALLHKPTKFMFLSSAAVYGDKIKDACDEHTPGSGNPLELRSCYEESKRMGENLVISFGHQFDIDTVIIRPYHVYGPGMALGDGRVISDFVENAVNSQPVLIRGDGLTTRTLLYIDDFIEGALKVLFNGKRGEAYNIGNPYVELSTLEMAKVIAKIFNLDIQINVPIKDGYLPSPINKMPINVARLINLGWKPNVEFPEGIVKTIEYSRGINEMFTDRM
jgi:nucleoside-diphosphate-sugar epimerase